MVILRFKLSDIVMESISQFSKIYQNSDRKVYKEEWNKWMISNEQMVNDEINRMNKLGYNECVKDKMFKAGRYYFRKKDTNDRREDIVQDNDIDIEKKDKRKYIKLNQKILDLIDVHIKMSIDNEHYTPANGYTQFCLKNIPSLREERKNMQNEMDTDEFLNKIKKTYKNRYFIVNKSM